MARMAEGFSGGKHMIALLSRAYQQSEFCKKEYEQVLADDPRNLRERLLVFRIDDVVPIEHLKDLAYTDLLPVLSDSSALARIVRVAVGIEKRQAETSGKNRSSSSRDCGDRIARPPDGP